ncbi:MAG: T9SS type A sorting domain-containing protein [Candidatus Marinimicrobia bacterium]|nr:T9SS type A sorting domain-containing protein [Candidatus Neomarinimicrobiota bacterium]
MLVSSIYGKGAITSSDLDLASFVLAPRVDNPVMPELIDVHIVDANFNETQGFVKATSLANVPEEFKLEKNYPNPFNPTTNIRFAIPEQGNVSLVVYDLLGNKIKTLVSSSMKAGFYNAAWNATNEAGLRVSSGVYFYRLMVGNRIVDTKKMVLMK